MFDSNFPNRSSAVINLIVRIIDSHIGFMCNFSSANSAQIKIWESNKYFIRHLHKTILQSLDQERQKFRQNHLKVSPSVLQDQSA